jgi:glycerate-2-kinase
MDHAVILSGGTDGEDGPTNAAGAFADQHLIERLQQHKPDAADHLHRNDAYTFFQLLDGLILCGPTHTNVCDLRIVLTEVEQSVVGQSEAGQ